MKYYKAIVLLSLLSGYTGQIRSNISEKAPKTSQIVCLNLRQIKALDKFLGSVDNKNFVLICTPGYGKNVLFQISSGIPEVNLHSHLRKVDEMGNVSLAYESIDDPNTKSIKNNLMLNKG